MWPRYAGLETASQCACDDAFTRAVVDAHATARRTGWCGTCCAMTTGVPRWRRRSSEAGGAGANSVECQWGCHFSCTTGSEPDSSAGPPLVRRHPCRPTHQRSVGQRRERRSHQRVSGGATVGSGFHASDVRSARRRAPTPAWPTEPVQRSGATWRQRPCRTPKPPRGDSGPTTRSGPDSTNTSAKGNWLSWRASSLSRWVNSVGCDRGTSTTTRSWPTLSWPRHRAATPH